VPRDNGSGEMQLGFSYEVVSVAKEGGFIRTVTLTGKSPPANTAMAPYKSGCLLAAPAVSRT
jgi:hypothetical protein